MSDSRDGLGAEVAGAAGVPVLAAGALCWKAVGDEVQVLVVRRTQHRDVSFPKGKLEPGETLPECAVREIAEETGLCVGLGAPLGTIEYTLPSGRPKIVYYWLAEVGEAAIGNSTFVSNDEIESLEWMPIDLARESLSYEHDIDLLDRFADRVEAGTNRTFAIIVLRHGKAVSRDAWDGPDSTRPLLQKGADQAASVAHGIAAFRPKRLVTSDATRCVATIAPLARLVGLDAKEKAGLSQDAWADGNGRVPHIVRRVFDREESAVLCSHGPVLPEIVHDVVTRTGAALGDELRHASSLGTGDFCAMHVSVGAPNHRLVAVETHQPTV
ncbi:NUDIX hydrolase [Ruicaihuangia caeni]|uniref:NUDIX hydrolase n=1 Tax=Ruicaihuangia caeni TaxID=3042517 RepID=A0AAW6TCG8_9MICO|nr:NUDIX hydrolase [Klugiella sp. YN-L-19]MDI2098732.1 NUDIX hydrolase [Klugiella sp. YN-L-19]